MTRNTQRHATTLAQIAERRVALNRVTRFRIALGCVRPCRVAGAPVGWMLAASDGAQLSHRDKH